MTDWLEIDRLCHAFADRWVIDRLSLRVPEDRPILAVVGPSGIGKSTILRILAGHLVPTSGMVRVCGETVDGPNRERPMVFQDHNLFPWKTVIENVTFGLKCAGVRRQERIARGREILEMLRLAPETEGLFPAQLSGGMQQRVGLARALGVSPDCILMDEPFSALDGDMRETLSEEISRLAGMGRCRFVIVTHDLQDAAFLADTVLVFSPGGRVREMDGISPAHPRHRDIRFQPEALAKVGELRAALTAGSAPEGANPT